MTRLITILLLTTAVISCAASPTGNEYLKLVSSMVKEGELVDTELGKLYDRGFKCYPVKGRERPESGGAMSCLRNVGSMLPPHGCNQWIKLIYSDTTGRVEKIEAFVACAGL
jgi:hypothetical protein